MRAQVDQKFRSGFELTEEGLVKIGDILQSRLKSHDNSPAKLTIDVKRVDHALITYDNIADVLKEDNGKIDRINYLKIYDDGTADEFSISFEKYEKTRLTIVSDSRDRALLALADLREYIKNEVVIHRLGFVFKLLNHRSAMPIVLLVSMVAVLFQLTAFIKRTSLPPIVNPTSLQQIDYLYRSRLMVENAPLNNNMVVALLFWPIIIVIFFLLAVSSWNFVYQTDVFMWGKEKDRVMTRRSLIAKSLWTIGIGSLVSIFAGILVNNLK